MPYHVVKNGNRFCVEKVSDGKKLGCHATQKEADSQMAAVYANESPHAAGFTLIDASRRAARREVHEGRPHVVVPVVALKQGVIHAMNSDANEFVPGAELNARGWDGKPIFVGHPLRNGVPVSARAPGVLAESIGHVRNASVTDDQLLMEAWIDETKADADLVNTLLADLGMDVSVGAFVSTDNVSGEHDGKSYAASWRDIKADHLALLPGQQGACSWDMGCGVRACSQFRAAWPDKSGFDDHGRGAAAAHEAAATAHDRAALAHAFAHDVAHTDTAARAKESAVIAKQVSDHADTMTTKATNATTGRNKTAQVASEHAVVNRNMANGYAHAGEHQSAESSHRLAASYHRDAAAEHRLRGAAGEGEMDHMYARWLQEGPETDELLKTLRNIPQSERDKMNKADFAGPNESFPIAQASDVSDAAQSIGRAKGDSGPIKAKIIAIAYRKGKDFVAQLPEAWKKKTDQKNASMFARMMSVIRGEVSDETFETLEDKLKAADCGCDHQKESDMTEQEFKEFVKTATVEQLKAAGLAKAPTEAELKAAADAKTAADLKVATDKKIATIASLKATGKNVLTDKALEAMTQEQLDAAVAAATKPVEPTFEDLLAKATPEVRASIQAGIKTAADKKAATVKTLVAAKRGGYVEAEFNAMAQEQLDKLVALAEIKTAVDFSGQGTPRTDGDAPKPVPPAPDMNAAIKAARAKK